MVRGMAGGVTRHLGRIYGAGTVNGLTDGQLLDRFLARRDEAAFEALVARHGPIVRGVCWAVLGDPTAADDAFQAAFLVLVRKAGSIRGREALGGWLHRVAVRIALRARAVAARRRAVEAPAGDDGDGAAAVADGSPDPSAVAICRELQAVVHEELDRLPSSYRAALVLCDLQGLTHDEAARRLRWPVGTVKGRLSRARGRLKARLVRRGIELPAGLLAAAVAPATARAAVPDALRDLTVNAALAVATRGAPMALSAGLVSVTTLTLTNGAARTMLLVKWTTIALGASLLAGALAGGVGILAGGEPGGAAASPIEISAEGAPPAPHRLDDAELVPIPQEAPAPADAPGRIGTDEAAQEALAELDRMRGTWRRVSSQADGEEKLQDVPEDDPGRRLVIDGNTFTFGEGSGERKTDVGTAFLNPLRSPKEIDLVAVALTGAAGNGGLPDTVSIVPTLVRGIYRLHGDTLTLCLVNGSPARPTEFATRPGDGRWLDVYERVSRDVPDDATASDASPAEDGGNPAEGTGPSPGELARRRAEVELMRLELDADKEAIRELLGRIRQRLIPRPPDESPALPPSDDQLKARGSYFVELSTRLDDMRREFLQRSQELAVEERRLEETAAGGAGSGTALAPGGDITLTGPRRARPGDVLIIEVLEALPGRPIRGERVVRSDGTISLDFYGDLFVAGLTRQEIKEKLVLHLRKHLNDDVLGLVEVDPDTGEMWRVLPAESERVFVDDSLNDRRPAPEDLQAIQRQLDEALRRVAALARRAQ